SDKDFEDLAAYYATQKTTVEKTPQNLAALGERIYRGGNAETGVPACAACHGPSARGNEPAGFPSLAGQMPAYIEAQLQAFQSGKRTNGLNGMMHTVAVRMTSDEIKAVSYYVSGLSVHAVTTK
ncbi:MAG: c-type cytochrome, partial [Pseudomonadota bacterium]